MKNEMILIQMLTILILLPLVLAPLAGFVREWIEQRKNVKNQQVSKDSLRKVVGDVFHSGVRAGMEQAEVYSDAAIRMRNQKLLEEHSKNVEAFNNSLKNKPLSVKDKKRKKKNGSRKSRPN